jgi:hypothetical protein
MEVATNYSGRWTTPVVLVDALPEVLARKGLRVQVPQVSSFADLRESSIAKAAVNPDKAGKSRWHAVV